MVWRLLSRSCWPLLVLGVVACSGNDGSPGPEPLDFVGSYVGTVEGTDAGVQGEGPATITLSQTDRTLTGTWTTLDASGTFSGEQCEPPNSCFSFVLTQTQPCNGIFTGTGNASSQQNRAIRITGTYTGTYCGGEVDAQFALDRQ